MNLKIRMIMAIYSLLQIILVNLLINTSKIYLQKKKKKKKLKKLIRTEEIKALVKYYNNMKTLLKKKKKGKSVRNDFIELCLKMLKLMNFTCVFWNSFSIKTLMLFINIYMFQKG